MGSKKEQIIEARQKKESATLQELATMAGVSREYVRQVLRDAGLPTRARGRPRRAWFSDRPRRGLVVNNYRFGRRISTHATARISELTAAVDLMRRGFDVFSPLFPTTACDLIVLHRALAGAAPMRVEVKPATKSARGGMSYTKPLPGLFDILALVLPDGSVEYRSSADLSIPIDPGAP